MIDAKLLRERKKKKEKTPRFRREGSWRYKRIKKPWKKPLGRDSKIRLQRKGHPKSVNIGYKGPKNVQDLHPLGYKEVLIHNPDEMESINPDEAIVRIAHTVGARKRSYIIDKAENLGIIVVNPRVPLELMELSKSERLEEEVELGELDLEEEEEEV